jgi:hypothetical protein
LDQGDAVLGVAGLLGVKPLIWFFIFSEMESPAASSPALLMRKPEDSFANEPAFEALAAVKVRICIHCCCICSDSHVYFLLVCFRFVKALPISI